MEGTFQQRGQESEEVTFGLRPNNDRRGLEEEHARQRKWQIHPPLSRQCAGGTQKCSEAEPSEQDVLNEAKKQARKEQVMSGLYNMEGGMTSLDAV